MKLTRTACRVSAFLFALGLLVTSAAPVLAQRADSLRTAAPARTTAPDSLKPPLTPRRAFAYSFFFPGYAQSVLGRHKTAALLLLVEGMSLSMIRESAADLREARRTADDSLVATWNPTRTTAGAPRFTSDDVRSRKRHEEDWIAILIANHLFAGADAFVAANLWDLPMQLSVRSTPNGTALAASMTF